MSDPYQPSVSKPAAPAATGDLFSQNPGLLSLLGGSSLGGIMPGMTPPSAAPPQFGESFEGIKGLTDQITGPIQSAASAPQQPTDLNSFFQMLFGMIPGLEQAFGQIPGMQGMMSGGGNDIWSQIRAKMGLGQ